MKVTVIDLYLNLLKETLLFSQEFVFFLLPLINIHKLKNLIVRRFSSTASLVKQPSIKVACHECGICNEPPTAPHQGQCGHVFCYYCIKVITNRRHFSLLCTLRNECILGVKAIDTDYV